MKSILEKFAKQDKLVALYTDCNDADSFHVVFILNISEDKILECNIGPHGEFDGFSSELIDDVCRIETDTLYLLKIKRLMAKNFKKEEKRIKTKENQDFYSSLLDFSLENKCIATIYLENADVPIIGYIRKIDKKNVLVDQISEMGDFNGNVVINEADINKIMINDMDGQDLDYLYKVKNSTNVTNLF